MTRRTDSEDCYSRLPRSTFWNYVRTLKHLKPKQAAYLLRNRFLPWSRAEKVPADLSIRKFIQDIEFAPVVAPDIAQYELSFLNKSRVFDIDEMDWRCADESKLWRYNLHYFDYLHWASYSGEAKNALINSWISAHSVGTVDAWEPYPISLRAVNWIKFLLTGGKSTEVADRWDRSLAEQMLWLEVNLEHHLLANHLLKNAKALVFSGVYFSGEISRRHLARGMRLMVAEISEQMLPDGGHFERSPMYHCIVLEDVLDVVNLLSASPGLVGREDLTALEQAVLRGLEFLDTIVGADGAIPLFNDSAFGIAPAPSELQAYGRSEKKPGEPLRVCLPDSGYFGYRYGGDSLMIDCGPIGPDYQPGHGHCDTLSYELCVGGRRIIVDSGVHDYEESELRYYVRSTAAHNTLRIDGVEQSEIWSSFRVARRAVPIVAELGEWEDGLLKFRGAHDGYSRLPGKPIHERCVRMDVAGSWAFFDTVTGSGEHVVESFVHIHPDFSVTYNNDRSFLIMDGQSPVARIHVDSRCSIDTATSRYCPEFGKCQNNSVLIMSLKGELPLSIQYTIEKV